MITISVLVMSLTNVKVATHFLEVEPINIFPRVIEPGHFECKVCNTLSKTILIQNDHNRAFLPALLYLKSIQNVGTHPKN